VATHLHRGSRAILLTLTVLAGTFLAGAAPAEAAGTTLAGNDISWPQCPKGMGIPERRSEGQPMPPQSSRFVVIGLTNGPGFYPNPCVAAQVAFAKRRHLYAAAYAMTTYPTASQLTRYGLRGPYRGTDKLTKLRNAGYAQAQFNVATMKAAGLRSPIVWVDVEPYKVRPWSKSIAGNRAVVQGTTQAYLKAGLRVGYYSTPYLWGSILGSIDYGRPEWRATGHSSRATALASCKAASIQGGRAVLGQWVYANRDWDVICPGHTTTAALKQYFVKY
jgi:hypothetical protein